MLAVSDMAIDISTFLSFPADSLISGSDITLKDCSSPRASSPQLYTLGRKAATLRHLENGNLLHAFFMRNLLTVLINR